MHFVNKNKQKQFFLLSKLFTRESKIMKAHKKNQDYAEILFDDYNSKSLSGSKKKSSYSIYRKKELQILLKLTN